LLLAVGTTQARPSRAAAKKIFTKISARSPAAVLLQLGERMVAGVPCFWELGEPT
jgi:hypothetical protein